MPADVVGYLYAATVAAGGIFGYVKAGMCISRFLRPKIKEILFHDSTHKVDV